MTGIQDTVSIVLNKKWVWKRTDFDQGRTTTPDDNNPFKLVFESNGKVEASAGCGRLRGNVSFARRALTLKFNSVGNVFRHKCRKDQAFQLFIDDLEMVREFELVDGKLRLLLRDGTAVMTFER